MPIGLDQMLRARESLSEADPFDTRSASGKIKLMPSAIAKPFWPLVAADSTATDALNRSRAMFLFCAIATFIDAGGTFIHLANGAHELNPIWRASIAHHGEAVAMGLRLLVGIMLLALLALFWRRPLARFGLAATMAFFIPLTLYHLFLLAYLPLL